MAKRGRHSMPPGDSNTRFGALALVINLGIIGLVLVAVVAVLSLRSDDPTAPVPPSDALPTTSAEPATDLPAAGSPQDAADAFLMAWSTSDWATVSSYARTDDAGQYLSRWWQGLSARSVDLSLREVILEDTEAMARFDASVELGADLTWEYVGRFQLVEAGQGWAVVWSERVAHPDLGPGETFGVRSRWPDRGLITASDGTPLVGPAPDITVGIIPGRVESPPEVVAAFTTHTGVEESRIESLLGRTDLLADNFYPVITVPRTSYAEVRPALHPVPGVAFRIEERRAPLEQPFADYVIGRTGEITAEILAQLGEPYGVGLTVGRSGLERSFETVLAGRPSTEIVKLDAAGVAVGVIATVGGADSAELVTALSVDVQRAVESTLEATELPAAIAVIDTETGGIRGVASRPLLDFDRALGGLYPPGSTFKIIVAAALLESGMEPQDVVSCPRTVTVQGRDFTNAVELRRSMTLRSAFAVSCNTAFVGLAQQLEDGVLEEMAHRFGFGSVYDAGLPTTGAFYPTPRSDVEAAASAIGQGNVLASPLHMASVAAAVATGSWIVPTLTGDGARSDLIDETSANHLRAMMEAVVASGTAQSAQVDGRVVAGKTGTAETGNEAVGNIAWFVGFSGDLAFAVMVEGGSSGGAAPAPLAAQVLERIERPPPVETSCVDASLGWLEYQGSGARNGCAVAPIIDDPRIEWRADVGVQAWLNSPVIVGDTVVVSTAGDSRVVPDDNDGVVAVNLRNGNRRWSFQANNDVNGVASDGLVVIATGDEGAVWALDIASGEVVWEAAFAVPVFSSPLIVGDFVVVGDAAGTLWALSLADGTVRWSGRLDGAIRGGAATDGTLIYAAGELGDLRAFTMDGFEIWKTQVATMLGDALVRAAPTIVGDTVVVSVIREGGPGGPGLVAYDKYVGTVRWIATDPGGVAEGWANARNSAAVAGSRVLFGSSLSYGFQSVDRFTGFTEWASPETVECERQLSSPVVVGDVAYLARLDGTLSAIDITNGEVVWSLPLTIAGERATAGECEIAGLVAPGAPLQATPAIAPDGTIVIGSMSGMLYAIGQG